MSEIIDKDEVQTVKKFIMGCFGYVFSDHRASDIIRLSRGSLQPVLVWEDIQAQVIRNIVHAYREVMDF